MRETYIRFSKRKRLEIHEDDSDSIPDIQKWIGDNLTYDN